MTERQKTKLENLPQEARELTPEEAEAVQGGRTSLFRGTKPTSGSVVADPCDGGEVTSR